MDRVTGELVKELAVSDCVEVEKPPTKNCPYEVAAPAPFLRIFVQRAVINEILDAGKAAGGNEIGAVLVGRPFSDEAGTYLIIDGRILARHTAAGVGHVTFTADTWTEVLDERERLFPEGKIVGWAHTHPTYGVFLSGHDVFIHKSFFDTPWLVAYVLDPHSGADGFFAWNEGEIRPVDRHYILEGDALVGEARFAGDSGRRDLGGLLNEGNATLLELKSLEEGLSFLDRRIGRVELLVRIVAPLVGVLLLLSLALVLDRFPLVRELKNLIGAEVQVTPERRPPAPQCLGKPAAPH